MLKAIKPLLRISLQQGQNEFPIMTFVSETYLRNMRAAIDRCRYGVLRSGIQCLHQRTGSG